MAKTTVVVTLNSHQTRVVMAALLGFSNMGFTLEAQNGRPGHLDVNMQARLKDAAVRGCDAGDLIIQLGMGIYESDEMADGFEKEARWWFKDIKSRSDAYLAKTYPDVWALVNGTAKLPAKRRAR